MIQHFNMIFVLITASILNTYIHTSMNFTWNVLLASIIVNINVLQWQSSDHLCSRVLIDFLLYCIVLGNLPYCLLVNNCAHVNQESCLTTSSG